MNESNENHGHVWVELVGGIIIAQIRGRAAAGLLRDCQNRVMTLHRDTGCKRVMYDALELERPPRETVLTQQELTAALKQSGVKVAIVVPNTTIAYFSRLVFGEADHRVFYNDIAAAVSWLSDYRPSG